MASSVVWNELVAADSRFHIKEDRRIFLEAVREKREGLRVIRSSSSSV